jgi:hypothetical protein
MYWANKLLNLSGTVTSGVIFLLNALVKRTPGSNCVGDFCRRFVWNFFRLENEHLNNCGQFRAVRDISIAPIDTNDQALLEKMMDEEDGVSHRTNTERLKERQSR